MNLQLIILGNGFDLHCGLESSYKNFFRRAILDTTGESYGLKQLQAGVTGFWESLLLEYHKINPEDDYNWCNIEAIIKNTLWLIYYGEESKSTNLESGLWRIALDFIKARRDLVDDKIYQDKPIIRYIFARMVKFFENIKFKDYPKEYSIEEKLHLLNRELIQSLNYLEKRFCKYLKNIIVNPDNPNDLNEDYIVNAVNLLAKLTEFSNGNFSNIDNFLHQEVKYKDEVISPSQTITRPQKVNVLNGFSKLKFANILSFNYTNIFDILEVDPPCLYNNVHGKLCNEKCQDNCNLSNIIFGIDDNIVQSQNEINELRLFSKTYRKMLNASVPINILPPNNMPLQIKFYGHSLSESDYSYFQSIFDYYNLYSNNNVSLIFYYTEGYEQPDAIYQLINVYGKSFSNKEQGKNLMHKLLLENRLNIIKIS